MKKAANQLIWLNNYPAVYSKMAVISINQDSPEHTGILLFLARFILDQSENVLSFISGPSLGKGGFAKVYLAKTICSGVENGRRVAIKVVPRRRIAKPEQESKIWNEIALQSTCNHKACFCNSSFFNIVEQLAASDFPIHFKDGSENNEKNIVGLISSWSDAEKICLGKDFRLN